MNSWAIAFRLARRELRGGLRGFRVFLACLTLGVAAIAGVGSLSQAIMTGIATDARAILGGDVSIRLVHRPATDDQLAYLGAAGTVSTAIDVRAMARTIAGDGRSLIVASLDHNQLAELYLVRAHLEGLAARMAAQHATDEEIRVLRVMVEKDEKLLGDPAALARANRRFHKQVHLASHNRYLVQQLDLVYRTMALMATTSLAVEGRGRTALDEHDTIITTIEARDGVAAEQALKTHISRAFETRLHANAITYEAEG